MRTAAHGEWARLVQPIIAKCEVGAAFGKSVVFTPDGADALGKLMKKMAAILDGAAANGERATEG